jgi:hypothetical protein
MLPDRLITIAVLFCAAAALVISLLAISDDNTNSATAAVPTSSAITRDYCAQLADLADAVNPSDTNPFWGLAFDQIAGDPPKVVPGSLLDKCIRQ